MEDLNAPISLSVSRFTDDRASADSGISSRGGSSSSSSSSSAGSGSSDERSGSRSSALSGSGLDENFSSQGHHHQLHSHSHHLQSQLQQHQYLSPATPVSSCNRKSPSVVGLSGPGVIGTGSLLAADRYFAHPSVAAAAAAAAVDGRVWRDPSLFLITDPSYRSRVDSVPHQSLLMSHQAVASGSQSSSSSSSSSIAAAAAADAAAVSPSQVVAAAAAAPSTPTAHYPQSSSMIAPHLHHQLPPHGLYPGHVSEVLWKQQQRYAVPGLPMAATHLHQVTDELFERERAASYHLHDRGRHDRLLRERERERERERDQELEKEAAEKDREKHQLEKDKLEKQRAEQAVHEHFTESLKRSGYNLLVSPVPAARIAEDERKRIERDQQRVSRPEIRDKYHSYSSYPAFSTHNVPPKSVSSSSKNEYITSSSSLAVIPNRVTSVKTQMTLPKSSEPPASAVYSNMYGYSGYPPHKPPLNYYPTDKLKVELLQRSVTGAVVSSLANAKSSSDRERERDRELVAMSHSAAIVPLDMKNSVIVKNDGKNALLPSPHLLTTAPAMEKSTHSSSPKVGRVAEPPSTHYLQPPHTIGTKSNDYHRSPTQSPHAPNNTSPHQLYQRQPSVTPTHHRQSPLSSSHHRQSPHHGQSSLPPMQQHNQPPQLRHSPHASIQVTNASQDQQRYVSTSSYHKAAVPGPGMPDYSYASGSLNTSSLTVKPKVCSPVSQHMYSKSIARAQEMSMNPVLKTLIPSSPYQQLPRLQPPPSASTSKPTTLVPPPAHSSQSTSSIMNDPRSDPRLFAPTTSHSNHGPQMGKMSETSPSQTQPLDLGMRESIVLPVESSMIPHFSVEIQANDASSRVALTTSSTPEVNKRKFEEMEREGKDMKKLCTGTVCTIEAEKVTTLSVELTSNDASPLASATTTIIPAVQTGTAAEEENTTTTAITTLAPPPPCSSPSTPVKNSTLGDCEKSNSPKPPSYGGHKLKKAWLQRHSGEDIFDDTRSKTTTTSSTNANGSLSINEDDCNVPDRTANSGSPVTKDVSEGSRNTSLNNSLSSIGSMAVNSISKNKTSKVNSTKKTSRSIPSIANGHVASKMVAATNSDESSSSEADTKSSPKRIPPKVKKKKHAVAAAAVEKALIADDDQPKRKKLNSTSSTDSDKESASEKDSDNSTSKKTTSGGRDDKKDNSRKRGRKPKVSGGNSPTSNGSGGNGNGKDSDGPKEKKFRDDPSKEQKDPFPKPPVSQLKKTGESFLQDGPCFEVAPKLAKCRECRWTPNQRSRTANIFCRFYAFRRLRYTKNGQLAIAGFSDPHNDAKQEDLNLWLPNTKNPPIDLDLEVARFTLVQVGDQFCDLLTQEAEALNIHISEDKKIAWKRVVQGVREMCDVCETTLFNFHWACSKCGFVVCIDCYKSRKNGTVKVWGDGGKDRDDMSWLLCTNRQAHEQEKLMLTQIIAGDSLMTLAKLAHESRAMWDIAMYCGCSLSTSINVASTSGICKEILRKLKQEKRLKKAEQLNGQIKSECKEEDGKKDEKNSLTWLADVALSNQNKSSADECDSSSDSEDGNFSTLRELLIRPSNKSNGSGSQPASPASASAPAPAPDQAATGSSNPASTKIKQNKAKTEMFDEMLTTPGSDQNDNNDDLLADGYINGNSKNVQPRFFMRKHASSNVRRPELQPIRIMTLSESKLLYPDVPHSWLCDGKLLRLKDPTHPGNFTIFQDQWRRGQPVIVSDVSKRLDLDLWHPDSFIKDFGDVKNDLMNCMTGNIVPNQPMRKFWEGFEYMGRRLKDDKGNAMLLKLKDWPPGEDFAEMLPSRYNDLMNVLPLSEYTRRIGKLNLASRLPECFVRPDLGPKMYNAYGSAMYPNKGTTNLHLDISDAVNVMVYVGIPKDGENEKHIKEAYRAIDEAGCDILTRRRVREKGELPGALWHIYAARDADKIRDLLNKVAIERGARLEPNHDPIHDQSWYLDGSLRERLFKEYTVEGYAIVQCMGDAVFVPAGAPHQVRNLHNCIKVAEDFVSPENVSHCFHLTQEFRDLSDTHSNHEDKLQIKNIMYHAVKDSLSVLGAALLKNSSSSSSVKKEDNNDEEAESPMKSESEGKTETEGNV